jgi:hypothetical protein
MPRRWDGPHRVVRPGRISNKMQQPFELNLVNYLIFKTIGYDFLIQYD